MSTEILTGWGRTSPSAADVESVAGVEDVVFSMESKGPRGILPRGLGRSYGDAAQNAGGVVLDMTTLRTPFELDTSRGILRVGSGVSIDAILKRSVPWGWFIPVTPGTRQVTIGGAIAADIHGKNHHIDGSFCSHVTGMILVSPTGIHKLSPQDPLFWATAGGMGLTGVVVEATIQMTPIETSLMIIDTERTPNLDATITALMDSDRSSRYSVAWIDCLSTGPSLGRAVLTRGDHARLDELPVGRRDSPLDFSPTSRLSAPPWAPSGLLNRATIRLFNEAWFRRAPALELGAVHQLGAFFHPLDGVVGWNRLYGSRGFLQYQIVVPFGAEEALRNVMELLSSQRCPSFLGVLKTFGPSDDAPMSFPLPGWTLALDMPIGVDGLGEVLDRADDVVAAAGGRVYLAKDSRLRPELLEHMYPRLPEWRQTREAADPERMLRSDLSRRLAITEEA